MARQPYKKPTIPENTCPYIDMTQELIENMATQDDAVFRAAQAEIAKALLEHVRTSNIMLRDSSHYWYTRSKKSDPNSAR
jgi:formaldehyde-activating enzyme involved in methanogenesis